MNNKTDERKFTVPAQLKEQKGNQNAEVGTISLIHLQRFLVHPKYITIYVSCKHMIYVMQ